MKNTREQLPESSIEIDSAMLDAFREAGIDVGAMRQINPGQLLAEQAQQVMPKLTSDKIDSAARHQIESIVTFDPQGINNAGTFEKRAGKTIVP